MTAPAEPSFPRSRSPLNAAIKRLLCGYWDLMSIAVMVGLWIWLVHGLMIADVWDETSFILYSSSEDFLDLMRFIWSKFQLFRPVPLSAIAVMTRIVTDYELCWKLLRWLNAAMLLGSMTCLIGVIQKIKAGKKWHLPLFAAGFLFSGSAIMVGTWFANIFDASALLFLSVGLFCLFRGNALVAGLAFGVAFFCKESAVLIFPVLFFLASERWIPRRAVIRAAACAFGFFAAYWLIRSRIVVLGSAEDIHRFSATQFFPTLYAFVQRIWYQMHTLPTQWLHWIPFAATLFVLRRKHAALAFMGILGISAIMYLGMIPTDGAPQNIVSAFSSRLFLIPACFSLLLVLLGGESAIVVLLLAPTLWGAHDAYVLHKKLQTAYLNMYQVAANEIEKPLLVHVDAGGFQPLADDRRGIKIGYIPNAEWEFDVQSGSLNMVWKARGVPRRALSVTPPFESDRDAVITLEGGVVDAVTCDNDKVRIEGWVVMADYERRQLLEVRILPRPLHTEIATAMRQDVVNATGKPSLKHSGFIVEMQFRNAAEAAAASGSVCVSAGSLNSDRRLLIQSNQDCKKMLRRVY